MKTNINLASAETSALDLKLALIETTNYAGEWAGELFNEAIFTTNTMSSGISTFMNVPNSMNLSILSDLGPITQGYTCDFIPGTDMTISDTVLRTERFSIQKEICKSVLWQTWYASRKSQGVENNDPALSQFLSYLQAYYLKLAARDLENIMWNSSTLTGAGFLGLTDGYLQLAVTAGSPSLPLTVITSANIIAKLEAILLASTNAVNTANDFTIYMNNKMLNMYRIALTNNGGSFFNAINGTYSVATSFGLINIVVAPLLDNQFLATNASNLVFGSDMTSMANALSIVDMAIVAEDNIRFRLDYLAGMQILFPTQVVVVV